MKRLVQNYLTIAAGLVLRIPLLPVWENAKAPVTFVKNVLPILRENCQTCNRLTADEMDLAWVTIAPAPPLD